jgi:uncharacterized protein
MMPQSPKNPFLQFRARTVLFYGGVVIPVVVGLGLRILGIFVKTDAKNPSLSLIIYILLMAGLCGWLLQKFNRLGIRTGAVIGKVPPRFAWISALGLVIALLMFSSGTFVLSVALLALIFPPIGQALLDSASSSPDLRASPDLLDQILFSFALIVVAPITEEFVFRGVLLQRWSAKWGTRSGLLASSLLFGMLHLNILGLSMVGLVMGLLYLKTRTLWVPIACHALNNGIVVLIMLLSTPAKNPAEAQQLSQINASIIPAIVLITLSAPWLIWFIKQNWPRQNTLIPYLRNIKP